MALLVCSDLGQQNENLVIAEPTSFGLFFVNLEYCAGLTTRSGIPRSTSNSNKSSCSKTDEVLSVAFLTTIRGP